MKSLNLLLLIGLLFSAIPAGLATQAFFAAPQNWNKLFSPETGSVPPFVLASARERGKPRMIRYHR